MNWEPWGAPLLIDLGPERVLLTLTSAVTCRHLLISRWSRRALKAELEPVNKRRAEAFGFLRRLGARWVVPPTASSVPRPRLSANRKGSSSDGTSVLSRGTPSTWPRCRPSAARWLAENPSLVPTFPLVYDGSSSSIASSFYSMCVVFFWSEWCVCSCSFFFFLVFLLVPSPLPPFSRTLTSTQGQPLSSATQQIVIFIINGHLLQRRAQSPCGAFTIRVCYRFYRRWPRVGLQALC